VIFLKTLIIGSGAMGSLFAGKLKQSNFDITLFNRTNNHVNQIKEKGLRIIERDGTVSQTKIPVITEPEQLKEKYDLIIILVKTFVTGKVIEKILHTISKNTLVLTLQNGVGNLEALQRMLPNHEIAAGGTNSGAGVVENGLIAHRAWGDTFIGHSGKQSKSLKLEKAADMFTQSGLQTYVVDDVQSIIWSKLLLNVAYNGLTAVTRLKNGEVVLIEDGQEIVRDLVEEALSVAKAQGIPLLYENPVRECIEMGLTKIGENKSSMLTDVLNKRKTEIDVINGAIVKYGEMLSIPTPCNKMITQLIKVIENSYLNNIEKI
jgi:2-dehydropantoate 2-reductase